MPTASGLNDYDYQNLSTLSMNLKQLNQLTTVNKVPIPPEVMEHFKHIKCHCMMGLFPEIGRAWLTIDSDIYVIIIHLPKLIIIHQKNIFVFRFGLMSILATLPILTV